MIIDGNNFISHHLKNNKLFAAGKIGVTEGKILYFYHMTGKSEPSSLHEGYMNSGIFPKTEETVKEFCDEYLKGIKCLDLAPIWCDCILPFETSLYKTHNPKCYNTKLEHLEPYYFDSPWTKHLTGKKVLVVSPFAKTITEQFKNFDNIWNGFIKKDFELKVLKFPFCVGLTDDNDMSSYGSYKNLLEAYKEKIKAIDFDFCILGTGAYALPLCDFIKNTLNKSCLHLGGPTQVLFGILGNRWKENTGVQKFVNKHWTHPLSEDTPVRFKQNEGGCYW